MRVEGPKRPPGSSAAADLRRSALRDEMTTIETIVGGVMLKELGNGLEATNGGETNPPGFDGRKKSNSS